MTSDVWQICAVCDLKHRPRPDGGCPRCEATPNASAPGPSVGFADYERQASASGEGLGFAILTGVVGALVGGGLWAVVVLVTGYEVGWVAWGVGGIAGFGVRFGLGEGADGSKLLGGACALVGLIFGKLLMAGLMTGGDAAELAQDQDFMTEALLVQMSDAGELPSDVAEAIRGNDADRTMAAIGPHVETARRKINDLTPSERYEVAKAYNAEIMGGISLWQRLMFMMSAWDLLWFGLAISTATKVASKSDD